MPLETTEVRGVVDVFGGMDILVNIAAEQHVRESIQDITSEALFRTFKTNLGLVIVFYRNNTGSPLLYDPACPDKLQKGFVCERHLRL